MFYKMVVITVEKYVNSGVHTITIKNKNLFWVKMIEMQKGLGLKNMPNLIKKKYVVFVRQKTLQKNKRKNI